MKKSQVCLKIFFLIFIVCGLFFTKSKSYAQDYLIGPADVIEISIWGEKDLIKQVVVRPDGKVSFPLVGDITVAGKTTTQVKKEVETKIREYIPDAIASVIVVQLGSLQYYVVGKVSKPGVFNVSKPITVLQALALAGGLTTFADEKHIYIIRYYGDKTQKLSFNYKEIKKGENLKQNILLKRGDVVLVP